MSDKKYLTISEIEEILRNQQNTISYKPRQVYDYTRQVAVTKFLCTIEKEYGNKFKLITAHPKLIDCTKKNITKPIFSIGLWAGFDIEKTHYYLKLNGNPFYDAYLSRSWDIPNEKACSLSPIERRYEYIDACKINDILYVNTDWSDSDRNIQIFADNLITAFNTRKNAPPRHTYKKEIPIYDRNKQQTIHGLPRPNILDSHT